MTIIVKNKDTLIFDEFKFRCCIGKNGSSKNKIEGDKKTPKGEFKLENLYYRGDRKILPKTNLKIIKIKKNMAWSDNMNVKKVYNKLTSLNTIVKTEKLFRKDFKYDFFIPIKYNWNKPVVGKGSAIFIHLTKNYEPTSGCIGICEKDFLILIKLINKNTKVKIL